MVNKIEKKAWPPYFQAIIDGKKNFDLRINDFDIKEGDKLVLREWDPKTKKYTGRQIVKKVGYIAKFNLNDLFWPKKEIEQKGLQIISFED